MMYKVVCHNFKYYFFLMTFFSGFANAGTYMGLTTSLLNIRTSTGFTTPVLAGLNLGYEMKRHKLEVVAMSSISDDDLNQLITDVPLVSSLLYRFTATPKSSLHLDLLLGYSQVKVTSSYLQGPETSETFAGVSYGIGLEEALTSIPNLKFKMDFMQLYRGDQLKINAFNIGVRYAF